MAFVTANPSVTDTQGANLGMNVDPGTPSATYAHISSRARPCPLKHAYHRMHMCKTSFSPLFLRRKDGENFLISTTLDRTIIFIVTFYIVSHAQRAFALLDSQLPSPALDAAMALRLTSSGMGASSCSYSSPSATRAPSSSSSG